MVGMVATVSFSLILYNTVVLPESEDLNPFHSSVTISTELSTLYFKWLLVIIDVK